ncbi:uncharacterized protein H6S33_013064 [Morchella sextelata]|jgi:hypothetical protein|uniref:uncharacterized protein n=1 Tax=Morchella sextelata TaxID=1174677 RepID=UPI001D054C3C|nr:uncharacterized protein H6S33_013064 [Morchella sextelata]KAH0609578.1 hypothetical protein H6S33_013064 [Morchella sextelata]
METDTASTQSLPQPPHLTKRRVSFAEAPAVRPKLKEAPVDSESNHETEAMAKRDRDAIKAAAGGWEIERSIYKKKVAGSRTKGEESQLPVPKEPVRRNTAI